MPTHFVRLLAAAAFVTCASAEAALFQFHIELSPFQEQPSSPPGNITGIAPGGLLRAFTEGPGSEGPLRPVSSGHATFTLDTSLPVLRFSATIFDIDVTGSQTPYVNDDLVAAHIHAGPTAIPGVSAAPVRWGFFGTPFNDTDLDVVLTPFATGVGGTFAGEWDANEGNATTLIAQLPNLVAGLSYINFHTVQFAGGEIRGQLAPEPGTLALIGLALAGIYVSRRQQQKAKARA